MEFMEFLKDMLSYVIVFILVILFKTYVITPAVVVGDSMKGTLEDDDWLVIEKISTGFLNLKRFDIVIVNSKNPKYIVKRIVGLPGDKLEYKDNKLYINDNYIEETFLKTTITEDIDLVTIPENKYFVLGDNRSNSVDSRDIGLVSKTEMEGKVITKIWPIKEFKFVK